MQLYQQPEIQNPSLRTLFCRPNFQLIAQNPAVFKADQIKSRNSPVEADVRPQTKCLDERVRKNSEKIVRKRTRKKLEVDVFLSERPNLQNYQHIPNVSVDQPLSVLQQLQHKEQVLKQEKAVAMSIFNYSDLENQDNKIIRLRRRRRSPWKSPPLDRFRGVRRFISSSRINNDRSVTIRKCPSVTPETGVKHRRPPLTAVRKNRSVCEYQRKSLKSTVNLEPEKRNRSSFSIDLKPRLTFPKLSIENWQNQHNNINKMDLNRTAVIGYMEKVQASQYNPSNVSLLNSLGIINNSANKPVIHASSHIRHSAPIKSKFDSQLVDGILASYEIAQSISQPKNPLVSQLDMYQSQNEAAYLRGAPLPETTQQFTKPKKNISFDNAQTEIQRPFQVNINRSSLAKAGRAAMESPAPKSFKPATPQTLYRTIKQEQTAPGNLFQVEDNYRQPRQDFNPGKSGKVISFQDKRKPKPKSGYQEPQYYGNQFDPKPQPRPVPVRKENTRYNDRDAHSPAPEPSEISFTREDRKSVAQSSHHSVFEPSNRQEGRGVRFDMADDQSQIEVTRYSGLGAMKPQSPQERSEEEYRNPRAPARSTQESQVARRNPRAPPPLVRQPTEQSVQRQPTQQSIQREPTQQSAQREPTQQSVARSSHHESEQPVQPVQREPTARTGRSEATGRGLPDLRFNEYNNTNLTVKELNQGLNAHFNKGLTVPVEFYESFLYDVCAGAWRIGGAWNILSFVWSYIIHHADKNGGAVDAQQKSLIGQQLGNFPNFEQVLSLTLKSIQLISGILQKWHIAKPSNYFYRVSTKTIQMKYLNLSKLVTEIISPEVIWISFWIDKGNRASDFSEKLHNDAKECRLAFANLVEEIFKLNVDANYDNNPKIEGFIAAKFPAVAKLGITPDKAAKKPAYCELKLPTNWVQKRKDWGKRLLSVESNMKAFEVLYRNFEKQFIEEISN